MKAVLFAIFLTAFVVGQRGVSPNEAEVKFSKETAMKAISDLQATLNNLTEMYSMKELKYSTNVCINWCALYFTSCSASCGVTCGPSFSSECNSCLNGCGRNNAQCLNRCIV